MSAGAVPGGAPERSGDGTGPDSPPLDRRLRRDRAGVTRSLGGIAAHEPSDVGERLPQLPSRGRRSSNRANDVDAGLLQALALTRRLGVGGVEPSAKRLDLGPSGIALLAHG